MSARAVKLLVVVEAPEVTSDAALVQAAGFELELAAEHAIAGPLKGTRVLAVKLLQHRVEVPGQTP